MKYGENLCETCPLILHMQNDSSGRIDFDLVDFADNEMRGVPQSLERIVELNDTAQQPGTYSDEDVRLLEYLIEKTDPKTVARPMMDLNIDRRTLTGKAFIACREKVYGGVCLHFANQE